MNKGFTLVELLVVVLIIGVLSAIALPQYLESVERARSSEAMVNAKAVMDAIQRYKQMYPDREVSRFSQIADMQMTGGSLTASNSYMTDNFVYTIIEHDALRIERVNHKGGTAITLYTVVYTYNPDRGFTITCQASNEEEDDIVRICQSYVNLRPTTGE